jgi:ATP-dependent RNA circularization protein (DNA/RNA ligase family)
MRLLKSLNTGVVLPFSEAALLTPNVREMTQNEVNEYLASIGKAPSAPVVEVVEEVEEPEETVTNVEMGVTVTQDFSEGEPDVSEVLKALETE